MNFHFRPPRFKDPPPSSSHSGFHPPPFSPVEEEEEEESSLLTLVAVLRSVHATLPSLPIPPCLPPLLPSCLPSLSNFFPFFHFLRFLSVDKAFSFRFVSFSFFFFLSFIIRVFGFLFRLQREKRREKETWKFFLRSREGDVFHRRCVAGVSLLFLVLLDGFFNFISFNWTQLKFVVSKSLKEISGRKNNIPNETIDI